MPVSQRAHLFIHMHWGATWHILSGACIFYTCKALHHCMTFLSHIAYSTYVIWSYAHTFLSVVHIVCRLAVTVLSERLCLSLCGFAPLFSACASTHKHWVASWPIIHIYTSSCVPISNVLSNMERTHLQHTLHHSLKLLSHFESPHTCHLVIRTRMSISHGDLLWPSRYSSIRAAMSFEFGHRSRVALLSERRWSIHKISIHACM